MCATSLSIPDLPRKSVQHVGQHDILEASNNNKNKQRKKKQFIKLRTNHSFSTPPEATVYRYSVTDPLHSRLIFIFIV